MNLHDFLEQKERELLAEIVHLRAALIYSESELARVRRAQNAIGSNELSRTQAQIIEEQSAAIERAYAKGRSVASPTPASGDVDWLEDAPLDQTVVATFDSALPPVIDLSGNRSTLRISSPYETLTMKQLVLKALEEQFPNGATTRQLLDFFRDAWGREIERTNLSPQLTRLYAAHQISQFPTKEWFLYRDDIAATGRQPYRNRHTGEINWKLPNQARDEDVSAKMPVNSRPDLD